MLLKSLCINHSLKIRGSSREVMLINSLLIKKVKGKTKKSRKRNHSSIVGLLTKT